MLTYHGCSKCDAPVRRSRRRNMWEFILGVVMLPYRCTVCDLREMKLRFINMEPNSKPEDTDLIISGLNEKEMEEERVAEAKAAERAAAKAEKQRMKELAKKEAERVEKQRLKDAERAAKEAEKDREREAKDVARIAKETGRKPKAKKIKEAAVLVSMDGPEPEPVSPQSNTSDAAGEQISSN
jgi:hypothetical protein